MPQGQWLVLGGSCKLNTDTQLVLASFVMSDLCYYTKTLGGQGKKRERDTLVNLLTVMKILKNKAMVTLLTRTSPSGNHRLH